MNPWSFSILNWDYNVGNVILILWWLNCGFRLWYCTFICCILCEFWLLINDDQRLWIVKISIHPLLFSIIDSWIALVWDCVVLSTYGDNVYLLSNSIYFYHVLEVKRVNYEVWLGWSHLWNSIFSLLI